MTGKKAGRTKPQDNLTMLLLPSVLGICICLVCMFGTTWAWFTASVEISGQTISSANYAVTVDSVTGGETEITADADGKYNLMANTEYTVTLTASGSAKEYGGYCLIQGDNSDTQYTQTFNPDNTITISLHPVVAGNYTFTGVWGSPPADVTTIPNQSI